MLKTAVKTIDLFALHAGNVSNNLGSHCEGYEKVLYGLCCTAFL